MTSSIRVYWQTVLKWASENKKKLALASSPVVLLFTYLLLQDAIIIHSFTGDTVCVGSVDNPCVAIINFTAKKDVFVYPTNYDPWGRDTPFYFNSSVSGWRLFRSWGSGWREIKLNETCTGTWCGGKYGVSDNAYSYAFREGRTYTLKLEVYKENPNDEVKWGFVVDRNEIDPVFKGVSSNNVFNKLIRSDGGLTSDVAIYEFVNPLSKNLSVNDLIFDFKVFKGNGIIDYDVFLKVDEFYNVRVLDNEIVYNITEIVNGSLRSYKEYNRTYKNVKKKRKFWKEASEIPLGKSEIKIVAYHKAMLGVQSIDWVPSITFTKEMLGGDEDIFLERKEWAWWNSSFNSSKKITLHKPDYDMSNAQVMLHVSYEGSMQNDFDDLRFTASDNSTELDYWIRSKSDGVSANVVVEVNSIASGSNTSIRMWYGNPSVSSESDLWNTLIFGDDIIGSSVNHTRWVFNHTADACTTLSQVDGKLNISMVDGCAATGGSFESADLTSKIDDWNITVDLRIMAEDDDDGDDVAPLMTFLLADNDTYNVYDHSIDEETWLGKIVDTGNGLGTIIWDSGDTMHDTEDLTTGEVGGEWFTYIGNITEGVNGANNVFAWDNGTTYTNTIGDEVNLQQGPQVYFHANGGTAAPKTGAVRAYYDYVYIYKTNSYFLGSTFGSEENPAPFNKAEIESVEAKTVNGSVVYSSTPNLTVLFEHVSKTVASGEIFVNSTPSGVNYTIVNATSTNITVNHTLSDGYYVSYAHFNDTDGFGNSSGSNSSGNFFFWVETEIPNIDLDKPDNNTYTNNRTHLFNFTAVDEVNNSMTAILVIDDVLNSTNSSVLNNVKTNFYVVGLSEGNRTWYVNVTDDGGTNQSGERVLVVDVTSPAWSLDSSNNTYQKTNFYVNLSLTELYPDDSTSVWSNDSWTNNYTNFVGTRDVFINISNWTEAKHELFVGIDDLANNFGWIHVGFTIDTTIPTFYNISSTPNNNSVNGKDYLYLNYSAKDTNFNSTGVIIEHTNTTGTTNYTATCYDNSSDWICGYNITSLGEELQKFWIYFIDKAGNVAEEYRQIQTEIVVPNFVNVLQTPNANVDSRETPDCNGTITSSYQVSYVYLESNVSGSAVNYTISEGTGLSAYGVNFTLNVSGNSSVGDTYYWKLWSNNSVGWNVSIEQEFQVRNLSITIEFFENGTIFSDNKVDWTNVYLEFNTTSNNGTFELHNQSVNNITITFNNTGSVAESYKFYLNQTPRTNHTYYINTEYNVSSWTELNETEQFIITNVAQEVETNFYFWVVLDNIANYTIEILDFFVEVWEYV